MRHLGLFAALLLTACTTSRVLIGSEARPELIRRLQGEDRFLRVSCYATPFFADAGKKLITPVLPEEVRLLENPDRTPVSPGAIERTFPAGTLVRVAKVEFPSAFTLAERAKGTPRTLIWIYLDFADTQKDAPPYVLVLRPGLADEKDFYLEVDRYLSRESPAAQLVTFTDLVREAVLAKRAVLDMPAEALEMAWGYPESKRITFEGDRRHETWTWPGEKRLAMLVDGRVSELK